MPRDAIITYDQVVAVAAALVQEGIKPTTRTLRERLGNVGSMQTILRHLQNWKASQATPRDTGKSLPSSVQQAILDHVNQSTDLAKASLAAELADQQRETDGLAVENDRLAAVITQMSLAMEDLKSGKAMAEGQVAQLTEELKGVRTELAEAREAIHLLRIEQARTAMREEAMQRLEAELSRCQLSFESERQARVAAEQSAAVAQALKADIEKRLSGTAAPSHSGKPAPRRTKASS